MSVNMDFISTNGGQGDLAAYLAANGRMDAGRLRPFVDPATGKSYITYYAGGDPKNPKSYKVQQIQTNATLRRDEWKLLDEAVLRVAESRLNGIQDLINRGLTYDIGSGMNSTVLEWHDMSDALSAELTMDGITRAQGDRPVYSANYLPLPIIHADYELNARVLAASRNLGTPLDTTLAERAARKVNEKLESLLFTDTVYSFGGGTIYSYLNHPQRNKINANPNWTNTTKTAEAIITDVLTMKKKSIDNFFYGPWVLYVPTAYETRLDKDYSASGASLQTIRERILKISGIFDVKVIDMLPTDNILLVQMTSDVVRLVRGMGIQNVEWQQEGGMITKYKVMTIQVPQIRADQTGKCGVVHMAA